MAGRDGRFVRQTQYAQAVGTVGENLKVDHGVVQAQHGLDVLCRASNRP